MLAAIAAKRPPPQISNTKLAWTDAMRPMTLALRTRRPTTARSTSARPTGSFYLLFTDSNGADEQADRRCSPGLLAPEQGAGGPGVRPAERERAEPEYD